MWHAMPKARNAQRILYICYKGAPTHPTQEIKHTPSPLANECKLLDLVVWWKYRLVGHVWVHGSKLSFLSLRCLSENEPHFFVLGFGMEHWVLCNAYGIGAITMKWNMGILLTKVSHGVCDPKELRATTSSGNILCLGSGLSNTRLFAGRPRHQIRSQKLASPRSGLPIQPTPGKISIRKTMKSQRWGRVVTKAEVGSAHSKTSWLCGCVSSKVTSQVCTIWLVSRLSTRYALEWDA
jgi:hypothetical protein